MAFTDLFTVDTLGGDRFVADTPTSWPGGRVFGGLVVAQALRAAIATIDVDHDVHSLHAYFLRAGRNGEPITYAVDRVRDGKSFSTRTVEATQGDETIFTLSASFHRPGEGGVDYQLRPTPNTPGPDEIVDRSGGFPMRPPTFGPFEMRSVGPTDPGDDGTYAATRRVWMRVDERLPDDPVVHRCALAFMSDVATVTAARPPTGKSPWEEGVMAASLDHAVWFHRPMRADEWFLFDLHALSTYDARGLARGAMFTADGTLGVSMVQEALIRSAP